MERRTLRQIIDDNKFFIFIACISIFASSVIYITSNISEKEKEFSVSCFNGDLILNCKESRNTANVCSDRLEKSLTSVCRKMEQFGFYPLEKTKVNIIQYIKCGGWLRENAGCKPFFYQEPRKQEITNSSGKKYRSAAATNYIFFPKKIVDSGDLEWVAAHEMAHALLAKNTAQTTRILGEFFAVYAGDKISGNKSFSQYACGTEASNQPALASIEGNYLFPPKQGNVVMELHSMCRYGQLAHISRELEKKFSLVFILLWKKMSEHRGGEINLSLFHRWLAEIDKEAAKFLSGYYALKNTDFSFHAGLVPVKDILVLFICKIVDSQEEYCINRGEVFLAARKSAGGPDAEWMRGRFNNGYLTIEKKTFNSGDILKVGAVLPNGILIEDLVIP
jgi:hypothetical protein